MYDCSCSDPSWCIYEDDYDYHYEDDEDNRPFSDSNYRRPCQEDQVLSPFDRIVHSDDGPILAHISTAKARLAWGTPVALTISFLGAVSGALPVAIVFGVAALMWTVFHCGDIHETRKHLNVSSTASHFVRAESSTFHPLRTLSEAILSLPAGDREELRPLWEGAVEAADRHHSEAADRHHSDWSETEGLELLHRAATIGQELQRAEIERKELETVASASPLLLSSGVLEDAARILEAKREGNSVLSSILSPASEISS